MMHVRGWREREEGEMCVRACVAYVRVSVCLSNLANRSTRRRLREYGYIINLSPYLVLFA
jgi:hypothetical protein